jgi:hypothetical protein
VPKLVVRQSTKRSKSDSLMTGVNSDGREH